MILECAYPVVIYVIASNRNYPIQINHRLLLRVVDENMLHFLKKNNILEVILNCYVMTS